MLCAVMSAVLLLSTGLFSAAAIVGGDITRMTDASEPIPTSGTQPENPFAPVSVKAPYELGEGEDPAFVVLVENRGEEDPAHIIPRSAYQDEAVAARVYDGAGAFSARYLGWGVFSDTQGRWMDDAVRYLSARGVVQGVTNPEMTDGVMTARFAPEQSVTRAQFVTMLLRLLDAAPAREDGLAFGDAEEIPEWAREAFADAAALGIVRGDAQGDARPNDTITRQDMAVMVYRAMEKFEMLPAFFTLEFLIFDDWDDVADYAAVPLQNLAKIKLLNGTDGRMNPKGVTTRAEAAQFLYNLLLRDAAEAATPADTEETEPSAGAEETPAER
jgi:hypothetical protein